MTIYDPNAHQFNQKVTELVEFMPERKGMRVGQARRLDGGDDKRFEGLSGHYMVTIPKGWKFLLSVNTHSVYIERRE